MSNGIYVSMAGASARTTQLDSIADNLANAQTPGFKGSTPVFSSVLAEASSPYAFASATANTPDLRPGPVANTGNPLDVLPENGAFIGVQSQGGAVGLTRDGRMSIDADGTLRTAGLAVLSQNGESIQVPRDAAVQITPTGQVMADGREVNRIALFQINGDAQRLGPSVLAPANDGTSSATPVDGKLAIGSVETGNHSALDSAVELVSAQRSFDSSMQAIETYKHLGDTSNQLGRVR